MRNTLTTLLSLAYLLGSFAVANVAFAKTYKWVDENGATHYTATPPPNGNFKTIKPPSKPAVDPVKAKGEFSKRIEAFNKRQEESNKAKKEADKLAAKKSEDKKNCAKAKKNLNLLQTKVRVRYTDKDGSVRYLTDDERAANLKRAQEAMKSYCKK